ncbi:FecR family protein [Tenacibaculum sp. 190524A05c]|uniref:FecR family protein n=1 Tax=Tenacibaculum platacis TaxID=3137852 RepID=UPI0031FB15A5
MAQKYDDTFLARWLADELSENELKNFQESEDYEQYEHIINTLDSAEYPEIDIDSNFAKTLAKIELEKAKESNKSRSLNPYWLSGIAASLVLVFSYLLFFQNITYTTQLAEQLDFNLPDNSKVTLNADSKVSHKRFGWKDNRVVDLTGEAYFKVEKGQKFEVKTAQGIVSVLGTQFTVNSRENFFNVICYEGKVKVEVPNQKEVILTKGKALSFKNSKTLAYTLESEKPSWLNKQSSFYNAPIIEVINELERQFNIMIEGKANVKPGNFTGRFSHDNLETALKTIFVSMNIPFSFEDNKVKIQKY